MISRSWQPKFLDFKFHIISVYYYFDKMYYIHYIYYTELHFMFQSRAKKEEEIRPQKGANNEREAQKKVEEAGEGSKRVYPNRRLHHTSQMPRWNKVKLIIVLLTSSAFNHLNRCLFVYCSLLQRQRSVPRLSFEESERRALLLKEWSRYKQVTFTENVVVTPFPCVLWGSWMYCSLRKTHATRQNTCKENHKAITCIRK